jgi:hypothetical protein
VAVKEPWRQRVLRSLPSTPGVIKVMSYPELDEALAEAAGIRRMKPDQYAMRAIRAMVEYDLRIEDARLRDPEPLLHDIRRAGLPPKRYRGRLFGRWQIERLADR